MKRFATSIQVMVALLAIALTLTARGNAFRHTALRTVQDCYINPTNASPGNCVSPSLFTNTGVCTEPPLVYCCYTFEICPGVSTKVLVDQIILYRGI